jgi:hypothetical protein
MALCPVPRIYVVYVAHPAETLRLLGWGSSVAACCIRLRPRISKVTVVQQHRSSIRMAGMLAFRLITAWTAGVTLLYTAPPPSGEDPGILSGAEQQQTLSRVRSYVEQYVTNLPNFVCELVTRQFQAGENGKHWKRGDTLTSKLTFSAGREELTLEMVNNKPLVARHRHLFRPLVTEGEFGMLMEGVFAPASRAEFSWAGWQILRGKRVAVFTYAIDQQHSNISLSLDDVKKDYLPYHGSIYADPDSGAIWRITSILADFPDELLTKSMSTVVEYEPVSIGGQSYLLPSAAVASDETPTRNDRNELEFRNYQKFEVNSRVTFAPDDAPTSSDKIERPNSPPKK